MTKPALREAALRTRAHLAAHGGAQAAAGLARVLLTHLARPDLRGQTIAGYYPIGSEIDPLPALHALAQAGARLCLPETPRRGLPLLFRAWQPDAPLMPGRFGTQHPTGPVLTPDIVLVPLLAFDRSGNRLGYGAGYYDLTLPTLPRAQVIGCAFDGQELAAIPAEPHDHKLPAIATEARLVSVDPPV